VTAPATVPARGSIASTDRAFFGHPRGLGLLAAAEMWERFSYYGMRAILVLYLTKALHWSAGDASRLYGAYTGAVYLTPMIGGYLADRFLGTRRSLVVGGIIIAIGHFLLVFDNMTTFYAGLICVVIGTGFFKPNVSTMVGQLYNEGDPRRDAGFTIFYSCFNFGAFLAPLVCGYLAEDSRYGWHLGFGAAGVGMVLGLIVYLLGRDKYLPGIGLAPDHRRDAETAAEIGELGIPSYGRNAAFGAIGGALIAIAASSKTWLAIGLAGWLFTLSGAMSLAYGVIIGAAFTVALLGTSGDERKRVWALVMVSTFVMFFWLVFEQAGSSLTLFADRDTDLTRGASLFGMDRIPASWFQSIQPLCIILLGPFAGWFWTMLNKRNREPATSMKMAFGLFLAGLGFFLLIFAGRAVDAGDKVSPLWLVGAYFCHSLGEIALYPVGLSYVTKVAPAQFVSLLMGTFFLAISAANFLGGFLAGMIDEVPSRATFFTIPTGAAWGAGLLMLISVPLLRSLTRSVPDA
jgi:proton-dependent oligopeptide transporter, POT family